MDSAAPKMHALQNELAEARRLIWRLQGRTNAYEAVIGSMILHMSTLHETPFGWVQAFAADLQDTVAGQSAATDNLSDAERLKAEVADAMDHFLARLIEHAGNLPDAPKR